MILKIYANGRMTRSQFNDSNLFIGYSHRPRWCNVIPDVWETTYDPQDNYINDLKSVATHYGICHSVMGRCVLSPHGSTYGEIFPPTLTFVFKMVKYIRIMTGGTAMTTATQAGADRTILLAEFMEPVRVLGKGSGR